MLSAHCTGMHWHILALGLNVRKRAVSARPGSHKFRERAAESDGLDYLPAKVSTHSNRTIMPRHAAWVSPTVASSRLRRSAHMHHTLDATRNGKRLTFMFLSSWKHLLLSQSSDVHGKSARQATPTPPQFALHGICGLEKAGLKANVQKQEPMQPARPFRQSPECWPGSCPRCT